MKQWLVLFQKEILEMQRNFKFVWFPIAFTLLGVSEPLSSYYMPQIIESAGGLPEGAIIEIPVPSAQEVMVMSLSQFNTLGILIVVLASMGVVASERKSGVAGLILTKPVSHFSFITSKWVGAQLLLWVSFFLGYLASWYYVSLLFDSILFKDFFNSFLINGVWLSFALTIAVSFSTIFRSPGMAGFLALSAVLATNLISSTLPKLFEWSPSQLTEYANFLLIHSHINDYTLAAVLTAVLGMVFFLVSSIYIFRKKELAN